ncbi:MAG TPA: 2-dehydro-3-deoxygalactonokinase [Aurantimonas sp.]
MSAFCAAVDWGTSSFRLWLLDSTGAVLAECRGAEGMATIATGGFGPVLEAHLAAIGAAPDLPVIACGMVGARQGWIEAPYVDTPTTMAGIVIRAKRVSDHSRPVFVLPGVAQRTAGRPDVMRGEETQLAGLSGREGRRIVCLPGTHSKWVSLDGGRIESFATFMTGDLFAAIAAQTILRHSVAEPQGPFDGERFMAAFLAALERPGEVTNQLFAIRAGSMLDPAVGDDGGSALSGLLVGLEFAGAIARFKSVAALTLVAAGRFREIYLAACEAADIAVAVEDADALVRRGLFAAATEILS